jgi:hypothetical protein
MMIYFCCTLFSFMAFSLSVLLGVLCIGHALQLLQ